MLLIRILLEDYYKQSIETQADIYNAFIYGYSHGLLSMRQIVSMIYLTHGYNLQEIRIREEEINAALKWMASYTGYSDYSCIKKHKGDVKLQWIAKANKIAQTW